MIRGKKSIKAIVLVLVLMLCLVLANTSIAYAQNITKTTDGYFEVVANEKQLEILNRLYGTEISFGKLVETVFPEALEYIPESALRGMYQQNMVWPSQDVPSNPKVETKSQQDLRSQSEVAPKQVIVVNHVSSISPGQTIKYESSSRVWLPHPFYRIPYMSVLSTLERQGVGIVASQFRYGANTYSVSASGNYYEPPSDYYRTVGYHYGEYPSGYNPPSYYVVNPTPWRQAP